MEFIGVADCHGIESFIRRNDVSDEEIALLQLRGAANKQRHAVAYKVTIEKEENIQHIYTHLDNENYVGALRALKRFAEYQDVSDEDSWDKIPNPKLDPYG